MILKYKVSQKCWYLGSPVLLLNAKYEALIKGNWIVTLFIYLKAKWILHIISSEYIPENFRKKMDALFNWWFGGFFSPLVFRALFSQTLVVYITIWCIEYFCLRLPGCGMAADLYLFRIKYLIHIIFLPLGDISSLKHYSWAFKLV